MPPRQAAAARWTIANPDLRMGGFSWGYQQAWSQLVQAAARPGALRHVQAPVLVVGREPQRFAQICTRLPRCHRLTLPTDQPYQWAADAARAPWLSEITAMARARAGQTP